MKRGVNFVEKRFEYRCDTHELIITLGKRVVVHFRMLDVD